MTNDHLALHLVSVGLMDFPPGGTQNRLFGVGVCIGLTVQYD